MYLTKFLVSHSIIPRSSIFSISRAWQHRKSVETIPKQNRRPKFDVDHFAETLRPSAEDVNIDNQYEKLSNMVLPLSNTSYNEQLKIKQDLVEQTFDQIGNAILWDKRIDNQILKYVEFQQGHFCHVEPILPSPMIDHYRCKDDLTCGYGVDGQKTVGFYVNPRNNKQLTQPLCISPLHLKSMKAKHLLAVKHFDQFLKQHPLAVAESTGVLKKDQYWRTLTLKSNTKDQLMMIVVVHPQSLNKSELDQLKGDLINYFVHGAGRESAIDSIYFQTCAQHRCSSSENPFELIHGEEFLYETYNGKQFRISPESFLQVNHSAAEQIIQLTLKHANLDENTVLVDIGSGIGIYSILASPMVKKVYAIDPSTSCIDDGKFNATLNQCRGNIEWITGFAEGNFHRILKKIGELHGEHSRMVAIVNPSRYSLTNKTTAILRSLSNLQQILYILCRPDEQAMHNFYELAAGERTKTKSLGTPFIPTDVYPVDVLPHTTHTEIVVKCERV